MVAIYKLYVRINKKSNDRILEACVHVHVKDENSVTNYMDKRAKKEKVPKWLPFENCKSD